MAGTACPAQPSKLSPHSMPREWQKPTHVGSASRTCSGQAGRGDKLSSRRWARCSVVPNQHSSDQAAKLPKSSVRTSALSTQ